MKLVALLKLATVMLGRMANSCGVADEYIFMLRNAGVRLNIRRSNRIFSYSNMKNFETAATYL
mgnify:CR=1 FL=1